MSQLIRIFSENSKFTCAETKTEAILSGDFFIRKQTVPNYLTFKGFAYFKAVLAPMALDMLIDALKEVNFISICCDTSNRGNIKMLPIMVRYFSPQKARNAK